jgi:hypothetical protein
MAKLMSRKVQGLISISAMRIAGQLIPHAKLNITSSNWARRVLS